MNTRIRQVLLAIAVSATAAAAITGATLRAETKETSLAEACATMAWPKIPAHCLEGARTNEVRYVSVDASEAELGLRGRFDTAFQ